MSEVYYIRDYKESDKAFVKATFLRGLYHGDSWFSVMPKDLFMRCYAPVVEALISRNVVKVACLTDDQDVIIGYSILNHGYEVLHWVYVKKPFRGMGIGKALMPPLLTTFTHLTRAGKALLDKHKAVFNPFAI